jgi:hypothetical protein
LSKRWDDEKWRKEVEIKSSLRPYRKWRENIKEGSVHDNMFAPVVLFRARTNTLQLEDRRRFGNECTGCKMCGAEMVYLHHFIL